MSFFSCGYVCIMCPHITLFIRKVIAENKINLKNHMRGKKIIIMLKKNGTPALHMKKKNICEQKKPYQTYVYSQGLKYYIT